MTPYQKYHKKWKTCRRCSLCNGRNRIVLARGTVPCDVLFIGEAPGVSEDILGKPFVGPAGKLLDKIIASAFSLKVTTAFTNLVACIPLDDDGTKTAEPTKECIVLCSQRLQEFILLAHPKLTVFVGKLAAKHGNSAVYSAIPREKLKTVEIIHPAAILRMDVSQKGLAMQRSIVVLSDAVEEIS